MRVLAVLKGLRTAIRHVLAVVDVLPGGVKDGLLGADLGRIARATDELRAAGGPLGSHIKEPQLAGGDRARRRVPLDTDNLLPAGRPRGAAHKAEFFGGELACVLAIPCHNPQVVTAAQITLEQNAVSVGGEARLKVKGNTAAERRRHGSGITQRHAVNIAKVIKHHPLTVGGNVQVRPGAPCRRKLNGERVGGLNVIRGRGAERKLGHGGNGSRGRNLLIAASIALARLLAHNDAKRDCQRHRRNGKKHLTSNKVAPALFGNYNRVPRRTPQKARLLILQGHFGGNWG